MSYTFRGQTLPEQLQASIDRFVQYGVPTGGFLEACINNDLREACGRADEDNLQIIPVIVAYLYNKCPTGCWGYAGAHDAWIERKRRDREDPTTEES